MLTVPKLCGLSSPCISSKPEQCIVESKKDQTVPVNFTTSPKLCVHLGNTENIRTHFYFDWVVRLESKFH